MVTTGNTEEPFFLAWASKMERGLRSCGAYLVELTDAEQPWSERVALTFSQSS